MGEATKRQKKRDKKISKSLKGNKPWSKGLTKENNKSLKYMSELNKGKESWTKGLTKETDERIKKAAKKRSKAMTLYWENKKNI